MHPSQKLINHVAVVLDGSTSMRGHSENLIRVADEQIRHLALRSEELSQETRVSVYLFSDGVECLVFDMDVMRLPSIKDLYRANGMTALVDAVIQSQQDLATTSQIYGDHAFLTFVLTDGQENHSRQPWTRLSELLRRSGPNWTIGFLVPDQRGVAYMTRIGADAGSIAVWDTHSAQGLMDAASAIRTATDNFMTARSQGVRGTRSVFSTGPQAVNRRTVQSSLSALDPRTYTLFGVGEKSRIDQFVHSRVGWYLRGKAYYQLHKAETIQPGKEIIVLEKKTNVAYAGRDARHLIGLPDDRSVRVHPESNPDYDIFVQSTSINRNLFPNTKVLVRV